MVTLTPLQFGAFGGMELAVILLLAVLLFGANKIPKLARSTGQAMGEFQKGRQEIEEELQELEETASVDADPDTTTETTSTEPSEPDVAGDGTDDDESTDESK